ncbi:hypothetical protein OQA88_6761 [Cercophora sp. LCS_1]
MSNLPTPLLRLKSLTSASLPPPGASHNDLIPLLTSLLHEAIPIADSISPKSETNTPTQWKQKGTKSYPASAAKVCLSQRTLPTGDTWACRHSVHDDAAITGTAGWAEFVETFKTSHVESEVDFMPSVISADVLTTWDCDGISQSQSQPKQDYTTASYTSVERIRKTPTSQIEWLMATASDAGGLLPLWVQTRAVPGQIAKDVPLFLRWIAQRREEKK